MPLAVEFVWRTPSTSSPAAPAPTGRFALHLTAAQEHLAWQLAGSRRFAAQPWDVAECAAVDLATALKNYSESHRRKRNGRLVGFPTRKSRKAPRQSFRLRHPAQLRVDVATVTLPGLARTPLGKVKVWGSTRRLRRLLTCGRFRARSVTVSFEHHRWWISIGGMAAAFHPARRTHSRRGTVTAAPRPTKSPVPVGVDLGVRTLATAAEADGDSVKVWEGVKSLRGAQRKLRRANKALARTQARI